MTGPSVTDLEHRAPLGVGPELLGVRAGGREVASKSWRLSAKVGKPESGRVYDEGAVPDRGRPEAQMPVP